MVNYAGGAPGLVAGVNQINLTIPATVTQGNAEVIITVGDYPSVSGVTIAVR